MTSDRFSWDVPRQEHNASVQTAIRSVQRRWHGSTGFRLAVWATAVLALAAIASVSYQVAVVLGAVLIAVAFNYHLLVAWVVIRGVRMVRRSAAGRRAKSSR